MPAIRRTTVRRAAVSAAAAACALALLGAAPASATAASPAHAGDDHRGGGQKQLTGYFTQWGIYSGFFEKNLITSGDINHLTELDYAFSDISSDGQCSSADSWADYQRPFAANESVNGQADQPDQALKGNLNQLRELKAAYPKLKIVMSIGGWAWSGQFSQLASTAAGRQKFVSSCVDQYLKGDIPGLPAGAAAGIFDGFAVDWEYPGEPGNGNPYGPQDTPDYTALMTEFRHQLSALSRQTGAGHYLLTANTSANPDFAAKLELRKVAKVVDWFNVMTFDYHGAWENTGPTDFSSALFQDPNDPNPTNKQFTVDQAVKYYESQGVRAGQIGLAVPYYAHEWTGVTPGPNGDGLFQPAKAGLATTPNYNQVVTAPGQTYWDAAADEPYKYDPASGTFSSYDDPASLRIKGQYIRQQGLRGTFVWSLDGDTADGSLTAALGESLNGH
ncbi:glycoside hydrolase family 18 protein [Kitasatospora kifunensis]|uniref:chitinase n=1 Tax=Kitasatospora kifunensis TaxID=58351 RepID=A0A7W7QZE2_KITKI|nr:glycoside hydrolase family 18 protein [Kitasatospora kifunensis]MBB4922479.1 chitinase [Kitasatospora kifunensis]